MQPHRACLVTLKGTASSEEVLREVAGVVVDAFEGRAGVSRIMPSAGGGFHCFISIYGVAAQRHKFADFMPRRETP